MGQPPRISSGDKQVRFSIEATTEALVGQYPGILCEVTLEMNGQVIRQQGRDRRPPGRPQTREH